MTGRTNASISSGVGSDFVAYIQVATDANASITAVNLHGDTFTGTADNTGALTLVVTAPGTYTVIETGGGTTTVDVINYGASYSISVVAFDGILVSNGATLVPFQSMGLTGYAYNPGIPTIDYYQVTESGNVYNAIMVKNTDTSNSRASAYVTQTAYNLGTFSNVVLTGEYGEEINKIILVQEGTTTDQYSSRIDGSWGNYTLSLSTVDKTKKYYIGVCVIGNFYAALSFTSLKLQ